MANDVAICNLALGHLGDDATLSSLSPPDGSAQADHCFQFYPIARDQLLESHAWKFATVRAAGTLTATVPPGWMYAYQFPQNALKVFAVLPAGVTSDYGLGGVGSFGYGNAPTSLAMLTMYDGLGQKYNTMEFEVETLADGTLAVYTNCPNAILRYTIQVTDATKFSPLFVSALSYLLASYLAGPVVKGEEGVKMAKVNLDAFTATIGKAMTQDANNQYQTVQAMPGGIAARA